MGPTPAASPLPDPETIRRTAEQVLRRPDYQLDPRPDSGATLLEWLLRLVRWILWPFQWLFNAMEGLPDWLRWLVVVGLAALLIPLVFHIGYTIVRAVGGPGQRRGLAAALQRTPRDPAALERQAAEAVSRGDFITAIRLLYVACLLRLEPAEKRPFRAGTTNREHLRRHRDSPVFEPLKLFVETIETRWYGQGVCGPEDFEACRAAHARIRDFAQELPMLTARNFVALTLGIAIVSLAWECLELARPPDSGGLGHDSYGTRVQGQRGLFEILTDLGIPVERILGPPTAVVGREVTLVLWKPQPELVQVEPAYLHALARWVEAGGRVVVAPDGKPAAPRPSGLLGRDRPTRESTVLGELGLATVAVRTINLAPAEKGPKADPSGRSSGGKASETATGLYQSEDDDVRRLRELLTGTARPIVTRAMAVTATGVLSPLRGRLSTIEVPAEKLQVLGVGESAPDGTITFRDPDGSEQVLAAAYRRGKGELVVVASPEIAENNLIARHDNSVLAVGLLAVPSRPVVFDEFYHGLTMRGNPLWLFTRRGYAATTLCLLTLLGLWIWRAAVFLGPPLASPSQSRRSIGEYVDAMARLLNRGGSSQAFLLREVRSGVLRAVRDELHLPPSRDHVEELAAVLARRDPRRARQLVEAVGAVDEALSRKGVLKESVAVDLFKRMSRCL